MRTVRVGKRGRRKGREEEKARGKENNWRNRERERENITHMILFVYQPCFFRLGHSAAFCPLDLINWVTTAVVRLSFGLNWITSHRVAFYLLDLTRSL